MGFGISTPGTPGFFSGWFWGRGDSELMGRNVGVLFGIQQSLVHCKFVGRGAGLFGRFRWGLGWCGVLLVGIELVGESRNLVRTSAGKSPMVHGV